MNREEYQEYLATEHWQGTRKEALARAKYHCQVCRARDVQLEVHHNTYARLGHEAHDDLFVLCENCHELFSKNGRLAQLDEDEEDTTEIEEWGDGEEEQGGLRAVWDFAIHHPRWPLGGSSLLISFGVDIATHFNFMAAAIGIGISFVVGWKADDLVQGTMEFLIPGSNQEESRAVADSFADYALEGYPEYRDQSTGAKLRRLVGLGSREVVEAGEEEAKKPLPAPKRLPAKREVVAQSPKENAAHQGLTYEAVEQWFLSNRIDGNQFIVLLDRIEKQRSFSPQSENGESVKRPERPGESGESTVNFNGLSPEISPLSPTVSPEEEEAVLRAYFDLQRQKGKVNRGDIKEALGLHNKKYYIVQATCDKYGIAMPGGK